MSDIAPIKRVIDAFRMLPGVGPKSAQRYAYHMINMVDVDIEELSDAISNMAKQVKFCNICWNITEDETCEICRDTLRDTSTVCVVETPLDALAIEQSKAYKGAYHVLHGALSPTDGVTAGEIRVRELLERLKDDTISEVIVATSTSLNGEATAMYLQRVIAPAGIKVSRIARGLPSNYDIEYAEASTLTQALGNRTEMQE